MAMRRDDLDTEELVAGYQAGKTIRQLADENNTGYGTVYQRLTGAGVELRDRGTRQGRSPRRPPRSSR
jgi:hypothetical protein